MRGSEPLGHITGGNPTLAVTRLEPVVGQTHLVGARMDFVPAASEFGAPNRIAVSFMLLRLLRSEPQNDNLFA